MQKIVGSLNLRRHEGRCSGSAEFTQVRFGLTNAIVKTFLETKFDVILCILKIGKQSVCRSFASAAY